jgi:putative RecB family exonuclease
MIDNKIKPKFSFSQIDLYKRCPKAYEFQNIKKIPQWFSVYAYFWSIIHNTLQKFFEAKKRNLENPSLFWDNEDESLDWLLEIYNSKFNRENFWDEWEKFFERWEEILINFFEEEIQNLEKNRNKKISTTPFLIEKKFQIDFWDFTINWRFDRIDKITHLSNTNTKKSLNTVWEDTFEIIDYKTWKLRNEIDVKSDLQLWLYCIALEKMWNKIEKAHLYFLDHWVKYYFQINKENLEKSKEECRDFFENIKQEKFPATPDERKCKSCSFRRYCEFKI